MAQTDRFFLDRYGLTQSDLERYLAAALSDGGDYADLYFEYRSGADFLLEEGRVRTVGRGVTLGLGALEFARGFGRDRVLDIDERRVENPHVIGRLADGQIVTVVTL